MTYSLLATLLLIKAPVGTAEPAVLLIDFTKPRVVVETSVVRLRDVATVSALAEDARAIERRAGLLEVARFEGDETKLTIEPADVARALRRTGIRARLDVGGAEAVVVIRKTITLTGTRLERLARRHVMDALGRAATGATVRRRGAIRSLTVPAARWSLELDVQGDPNNQLYLGDVDLALTVLSDGEVVARATLPVTIERRLRVVKVARRLAPGRMIERGDVILEEVDGLAISGRPFVRIDQVIGRIAARRLVRGQVLTSVDLETPPVIRKGDLVTARASVGALVVETLCRALGDGGPGDRILLENVESKKSVHAQVVDARTVEVLVQ